MGPSPRFTISALAHAARVPLPVRSRFWRELQGWGLRGTRCARVFSAALCRPCQREAETHRDIMLRQRRWLFPAPVP